MSRATTIAAAIATALIAGLGIVTIDAGPAMASPEGCAARTVSRVAMTTVAVNVPVRVSCGPDLQYATWDVVSPSGVTLDTIQVSGKDTTDYWGVQGDYAVGPYLLIPRSCRYATTGQCVQNPLKTEVRLKVAAGPSLAGGQPSSNLNIYYVYRYSRSTQSMRPWPYASLKCYRPAASGGGYVYVKTLRTNRLGSFQSAISGDSLSRWRFVAPATDLTFRTTLRW